MAQRVLHRRLDSAVFDVERHAHAAVTRLLHHVLRRRRDELEAELVVGRDHQQVGHGVQDRLGQAVGGYVEQGTIVAGQRLSNERQRASS